jgi:hypothetical protein
MRVFFMYFCPWNIMRLASSLGPQWRRQVILRCTGHVGHACGGIRRVSFHAKRLTRLRRTDARGFCQTDACAAMLCSPPLPHTFLEGSTSTGSCCPAQPGHGNCS